MGSVEMASTGRAEMIRAIFAAYLANDRKHVEDALSDDFRFTSSISSSSWPGLSRLSTSFLLR